MSNENITGMFSAAADAVKLNAYVAKVYGGDYDRFTNEDTSSMVIEFLSAKLHKHRAAKNVAKAAYYYGVLVQKPFCLATTELKQWIHSEFKPWLKYELGMGREEL